LNYLYMLTYGDLANENKVILVSKEKHSPDEFREMYNEIIGKLNKKKSEPSMLDLVDAFKKLGFNLPLYEDIVHTGDYGQFEEAKLIEIWGEMR
jgi:hypothetical protein